MEPFFEEYPWFLVPLVIGIVEAWNALKAVVGKRFGRREGRPSVAVTPGSR